MGGGSIGVTLESRGKEEAHRGQETKKGVLTGWLWSFQVDEDNERCFTQKESLRVC